MSKSNLIHWGGLAAMLGGLLSILFAYGYVFTHGSYVLWSEKAEAAAQPEPAT